jgi:cell volume regulation protein A
VFLAGIMVGDAAAPFKREIERFHNSLSSLAEIIAFVVLGLTVSLSDVFTTSAGLIGLVLAVLLALVVRPLLVGPLLLATRMRWGERVFVLWSGLKGAVPILLGTYVLTSGRAQSRLVYEIIFVVVAFSVTVQGGLVPAVAARCRVPMREVEPRPYMLGLRLRDEPEGVYRFVVSSGSSADGTAVADLELDESAWISMLVRGGRALHVRGDLVLQAGDEVLLLADPETDRDPAEVFTRPAAS